MPPIDANKYCGRVAAILAWVGTLALGLCLCAWAQAATFTPSLSTGAGYDDNVKVTSNPQGDFFWLVRPAATLEAGRPENRFSANGQLDYAVYNRLTDNTRVQNANLGLKYHASTSPNLNLDVSNILTTSYDPVEQTETGQLTKINTGGGRRDRNVSAFKTTYILSPQTQVYGGYSLGFNQSTDSSSEDSYYHQLDLGGSYRFGPDWRSEVLVQAMHDDFQRSDDFNKGNTEVRMVRMMGPRREAFLSLGASAVRSQSEDSVQRSARDYDTFTAKLGYKEEFNPQLSLEAAAGAAQVDADPLYNQAAGNTYPAANLVLTYKQPRWTLRGFAEYKLAEYDTLGENTGLTITQRVGASWTWQMAQHWQLLTQADLVHDDFKQNAQVAGTTGEGKVDTARLGAVLSYQLARYWKLSLDYRYLNRDSEFGSDSLSQNRVLMLLTADWPQRW